MIKETVRVLSMIVLTIAAGAANGLIIYLVTSGARFRFSPMLSWNIGAGILLGLLACAVVVPLLWRRQLTKALPIVYLVSASCAGIASLVLTTRAATPIPGILGANAIGCLCAAMTAVFAHVKMPAVFDEVIPGHCSTCGYNLRGVRGVRCPECGHRASDQIRTAQSHWDKWSGHIRWWLVPTWIAPAVAYYLCMLIPSSAAVLKGLGRWPDGATTGVVSCTFLLSGVMVYVTLRGVRLPNRIASTLVLGVLLLPVNYLAFWCLSLAGIFLGFHA